MKKFCKKTVENVKCALTMSHVVLLFILHRGPLSTVVKLSVNIGVLGDFKVPSPLIIWCRWPLI